MATNETYSLLAGYVITKSGCRGSQELWLPWCASCCVCILLVIKQLIVRQRSSTQWLFTEANPGRKKDCSPLLYAQIIGGAHQLPVNGYGGSSPLR
jgi:hypothetical protein